MRRDCVGLVVSRTLTALLLLSAVPCRTGWGVAARANGDWQTRVVTSAAVDGRVVVTTLTAGYFSWLEQYLVSARRVGLSELVVVALDWRAWEWALRRVGRRHAVHFLPLHTRRPSGEALATGLARERVHDFGTDSYKAQVIMQRQKAFERIAQMGVSFILSDSDVHW